MYWRRNVFNGSKSSLVDSDTFSSQYIHEHNIWLLEILTMASIEMNKINNDLEVAHPQSGSWSTWFLIELEFANVGFWGEGKTGVPGENLSEQGREPTTNSTHIWRRRRDMNPGLIVRRQAFPPLRHPFLPLAVFYWKLQVQLKRGLN